MFTILIVIIIIIITLMIRKDRQTEERHIGQWGPWADECQISKTSRLGDDDDFSSTNIY